jgi:hypothetical protein
MELYISHFLRSFKRQFTHKQPSPLKNYNKAVNWTCEWYLRCLFVWLSTNMILTVIVLHSLGDLFRYHLRIFSTRQRENMGKRLFTCIFSYERFEKPCTFVNVDNIGIVRTVRSKSLIFGYWEYTTDWNRILRSIR